MEEVAYLFIPYIPYIFCRKVIQKAKIGHEILLLKSIFKMFDIYICITHFWVSYIYLEWLLYFFFINGNIVCIYEFYMYTSEN